MKALFWHLVSALVLAGLAYFVMWCLLSLYEDWRRDSVFRFRPSIQNEAAKLVWEVCTAAAILAAIVYAVWATLR